MTSTGVFVALPSLLFVFPAPVLPRSPDNLFRKLPADGQTWHLMYKAVADGMRQPGQVAGKPRWTPALVILQDSNIFIHEHNPLSTLPRVFPVLPFISFVVGRVRLHLMYMIQEACAFSSTAIDSGTVLGILTGTRIQALKSLTCEVACVHLPIRGAGGTSRKWKAVMCSLL